MRPPRSLLLLFALVSLDAAACSYPEPPTFSQSLSAATSVFVFRVEATRLRREELAEGAYSEWVEASIRVVESLKGTPSIARVVSFSTERCGGLRLDAGHYFLAATKTNSTRVELKPADQSVVDITDVYAEGNPEATDNADFIPVVRSALAGSPLPTDFPSLELVYRSQQTSAPPTPCGR
jgi:hypothetical protein